MNRSGLPHAQPRTRKRQWLGPIALLSLIGLVPATAALVGSCSRTAMEHPVSPQSVQSTIPAEFLPPFPGRHEVSLAMDFAMKGSEFWKKSNNTAVTFDNLDLVPPPGKFAWGIWQLDPGEAQLLAVETYLEFAAPGEAYLALADFSAGVWEIQGPFSETMKLSLDDTRHRSPGGMAYLAAIATNPNQARVARVTLTTDRHGWQIATVSSAGQMNFLTSLIVAGGNPAISWFRSDTNHLMYARSETAFGAQDKDWPTPVIIDLAEAAGSYHSLAVVNGHPALSYYQHRDQDLKYAWSSTPAGMSADDWKPFITVAAQGIVGQHNSLAEVDGNPAISYFNSSTSSLMYARSSTPSGNGEGDWGAPSTIDGGWVGWYSSLAVVDGKPAIAYYDYVNDDLRYCRSMTATGAIAEDWGVPLVVDAGGSVGQFASLAVIAGSPAIAYYDSSPHYDLIFARSTTASGEVLDDWATFITIDAIGNMGQGASLGVIAGLPAISYTDRQSQALKYAQSDSPAGDELDDWTDITIVDNERTAGWYTSLALVNGSPAISYVAMDENGNGAAVMYAIYVQ